LTYLKIRNTHYDPNPDGTFRVFYRIADGWTDCSKEHAISRGWKPSPDDDPDPRVSSKRQKRLQRLREQGFIIDE